MSEYSITPIQFGSVALRSCTRVSRFGDRRLAATFHVKGLWRTNHVGADLQINSANEIFVAHVADANASSRVVHLRVPANGNSDSR